MGVGENLVEKLLNQANKVINFDLDNWINDFEDGFTKYEKINPNLKEQYWGQGFSNRPRIKELNEQADAQGVEGYRVIEFFPDRDVKEESYLLFGTPIELMTQISFFMNLHLMLKGMDLGVWLGYPADEYLRLKPKTDFTLRIILTTYKKPPYYQIGTRWYSKRQVTIPCVDITKLTYNNIRSACGGAGGQDWGEWSARAYVSLHDEAKSMHQMVAGGNSEEKAKANLEKFLFLTRCTVRGMSTTKIDYSKGDRSKDPDKAKYLSFNVYPAWMTILNSKLVGLDDARKDGKKTLSGRMLSKHNKMFIYNQTEPSNFASNLKEVANKTYAT